MMRRLGISSLALALVVLPAVRRGRRSAAAAPSKAPDRYAPAAPPCRARP